jgi:hypothetical protein
MVATVYNANLVDVHSAAYDLMDWYQQLLEGYKHDGYSPRSV